jgi:hypothetical protein
MKSCRQWAASGLLLPTLHLCWLFDRDGLPLPLWERSAATAEHSEAMAAGEGFEPQTPFQPTPHPNPLPPNSGLPEFGTLKWPKSDRSDLGWEREPTEFVESSLAQTLKCDSLFSDTGH